MQQGRMISFEGPDGSGKTTNVKILQQALLDRGYTNVITTREPGGTSLGEQIRALILMEKMEGLTELLLFAAARCEHIAKKIRPVLDAGGIVLCDRFADSSYAFQGAGRGMADAVLQMEELVHAGFEPDYTLFFDVSLPECERRMGIRGGENRLDLETLDFKRKVYDGYLERVAANPHRMHLIDAMPSPQEVNINVIHWLDTVFVPNNPL